MSWNRLYAAAAAWFRVVAIYSDAHVLCELSSNKFLLDLCGEVSENTAPTLLADLKDLAVKLPL